MHSNDQHQEEPANDRTGATLFSRTGILYFPVALVARLPFAMMVIGVLTLAVSSRGSVELGGLTSAAVGLGIACFGPFIGAAADRYGQRYTLLLAGVVNSLFLGALAWIAFSPLPDWTMLVVAFLTGATAPQTSPMSRSRLVTIIENDLPAKRQPRVFSSVLAYESAADEVIFVFGPVLVGALAVAFGAWAPVAGSAILSLVFVTAFALHRTSAPAKSQAERAETLAPASELWRPALLITVIGIFAVGLFFGSMLTSLTSFMQDRGEAESAGLIYGVMGIGSAIFAIAVAFFPTRFVLKARWIVFALLILTGTIVLQGADEVGRVMLSLAIAGIGIGPMLVTLYSLGALRSPVGRSATVMSMLGTGLMVGQATAAAVTGMLTEDYGTQTAFVVPLVAGCLVVVTGVMNWVISGAASGDASRETQKSA